MYAVIETGGKQYRVELGSELAVERLDAAPGATINFDRVLLVADGDGASVGTPVVADATVTADVLRQDRGEKVVVFKYRPKARHRSKKGHRQEQTVLRIADIRFGGRSAAKEAGEEQDETAKARESRHGRRPSSSAAADQALAEQLAAQAEPQRQPTPSRVKPRPRPKSRSHRKAATKAKSTAPADTKKTAAKVDGEGGDQPSRNRRDRRADKPEKKTPDACAAFEHQERRVAGNGTQEGGLKLEERP